MIISKANKSAFAAFTLALTASSVHAHAIWFAQRSTHLAIIYGTGADDLDTVTRLKEFQHVAGVSRDGATVPLTLRRSGPLVLVESKSPATLVSAVLNNGTWSKLPNGDWVRKGRDQVKNATLSETAMKYAVAIHGPLNSPVPLLADQTLQIVPLDARIPDHIDQPMRLRIMFNGKAVAGAHVLRDMVNDPDAKPIETGADGIVTISVRNQGLNVVAAVYVGSAVNPKQADRTEHLATLSFVLPHAPE